MVFNLKIQLNTGKLSIKLEFYVFSFYSQIKYIWGPSLKYFFLYYIFVQFRIISVSNFDKIAVEDWIDTKLDLR